MNTLLKFLSVTISIFGAFLLFTSGVSAATAENIQPAAQVSLENFVINHGDWVETSVGWRFNETAYFTDIHVGKQGVGGVTYFNGTILNNTTDQYNGGIPVTFGDDVRIDGEIWRGVSKGTSDNMPLKISDTVIPTMDDINDLGSASRRWQDIYFSDGIYGNGEFILGVKELASPGSLGVQDAVIRISPNINSALMNLSGVANIQMRGYQYVNRSLENEIALGEFNFEVAGQNLKSLGYIQFNEASNDILMIGQMDNNDGQGLMSVIQAFNASDQAAKLSISSSNLTLSGQDVRIYSNDLTMERISQMKFQFMQIRDIGAGCEIEIKVDGQNVWQNSEDGTVSYGDIGSGNKLHVCSGGQWDPLH